jgi:hypothetical protein
MNLRVPYKTGDTLVRFQVLTAESMKMASERLIALMMEAVITFEMSIYFYQTTRHNIQKTVTSNILTA